VPSGNGPRQNYGSSACRRWSASRPNRPARGRQCQRNAKIDPLTEGGFRAGVSFQVPPTGSTRDRAPAPCSGSCPARPSTCPLTCTWKVAGRAPVGCSWTRARTICSGGPLRVQPGPNPARCSTGEGAGGTHAHRRCSCAHTRAGWVIEPDRLPTVLLFSTAVSRGLGPVLDGGERPCRHPA
jgi:hypothetical protein